VNIFKEFQLHSAIIHPFITKITKGKKNKAKNRKTLAQR
jgi:hypothetical protein